MADFSTTAPPVTITNPKHLEMGSDYPLWLRKPDHEPVLVHNDKEKVAKFKEGWKMYLTPEPD